MLQLEPGTNCNKINCLVNSISYGIRCQAPNKISRFMKTRFRGFLLLLTVVPAVRVSIFKDLPAVTVQGKELRIQIAETKPAGYFVESPAKVEPSLEGFQIGEQILVSPFLKMSSLESPITVEGKLFEGTIEIRRNPNNQLMVLNELPVEKYLLGTVPGEIPATWPMEVLKAQAVAARTYALYRSQNKNFQRGRHYDMESDTRDQVYLGAGTRAGDPAVREAIEQTAGEVLWYLGLFPSYFHSCCGGQTETVGKVWGKREMSRSVIDPYCTKSPYRRWELRLTPQTLFQKLKSHGLEGKFLKAISTERYETSPRNATVTIETDAMMLVMKAFDFRRLIGEEKLMSTWFDVNRTPKEIVFRGNGFGHGVGLCQWGAKTLAEKGADYKRILQFYYPKAVVRKIY